MSSATYEHDPLCSLRAELPKDMPCVGCWLVALRSDGVYDEDSEKRRLSRLMLENLADAAQAHLEDVRAFKAFKA